jgi:hypothetical protein
MTMSCVFEVEQKLGLQLPVLVRSAHRHMCHQERLQVLVLILPNLHRPEPNAGGLAGGARSCTQDNPSTPGSARH